MLRQYLSILSTPTSRRILNSSIHTTKPIPHHRRILTSYHTTTILRQFSKGYQNGQQLFQGGGSKTALVIGSSGSLGSTVAKRLKSHHDCVVIGSDIHPPSQDRVDAIDAFLHLSNNDDTSNENEIISIDSLHYELRDGIQNLFKENDSIELDAIIVASGGFAMDEDNNTTANANENNSIGSVYETMLQMNFYPVIAAGEIAKQYMTQNNDGLFVIIGALSALSPAPGMIAYSSSKAAAQYYIQTMGAMTGRALHREHKISRTSDMGHELRRKHACLDSMTALGLLPVMLDTKSNRDALPRDDFSQWTKPIDIAKEVGVWMDTPAMRPHSGSLMKVLTKDGETQFVLAR